MHIAVSINSPHSITPATTPTIIQVVVVTVSKNPADEESCRGPSMNVEPDETPEEFVPPVTAAVLTAVLPVPVATITGPVVLPGETPVAALELEEAEVAVALVVEADEADVEVVVVGLNDVEEVVVVGLRPVVLGVPVVDGSVPTMICPPIL
jgi:hypothetical protein